MLVVNYNANKPISDYFKFSVQGNNNADIIRFVLSKKQGTLDLSNELFTVYAKCQTFEGDFADKVLLNDFEVAENNLIVNWVMQAKHTSNRQLQVSLSFENTDNEVVWQTQLFTLNIANGIEVSKTVENIYPDIIQKLENEILKLKQTRAEIEIKRVWLSYDDKKSIRLNVAGVWDNDEDAPFVNDSTRIWVNFETTPINSYIEDKIKEGLFIIRLDYPFSKSTFLPQDGWRALNSTLTTKRGAGTRAYTYSLSQHIMQNTSKREILLNSLIFITESDIKTNRAGEKYIHKKVSFANYTKNMIFLNGTRNFSPITNEMLNNIDYQDIFSEALDDYYYGGMPQNWDKFCFNGKTAHKFYYPQQKPSTFVSDLNTNKNQQSQKLNPAFTCFCPFTFEYTWTNILRVYSPYFVGRKNHGFENIAGTAKLRGKNPHVAKHFYMSARPRCAVLNPNYLEATYSFDKIYPQSTQQIRLLFKDIFVANLREEDNYTVFRMLITQK